MTHIWFGNLNIIVSDNDLSPCRRQAIIWNNAGILLIGPLGTNFSESLIGIRPFSLKKLQLKNAVCKMAFILSRPQWVHKTIYRPAYMLLWALRSLQMFTGRYMYNAAFAKHCLSGFRSSPGALKSVVSLKRKCLHFDEIFITGCTGSCQNDNFQCSQWLKFRQNDDIFVSVVR